MPDFESDTPIPPKPEEISEQTRAELRSELRAELRPQLRSEIRAELLEEQRRQTRERQRDRRRDAFFARLTAAIVGALAGIPTAFLITPLISGRDGSNGLTLGAEIGFSAAAGFGAVVVSSLLALILVSLALAIVRKT